MYKLQTKIFLAILTLFLPSGLYCQGLAGGSRKYQLLKSVNVKTPVKIWHFTSNFPEQAVPKIAVQQKQIHWLDGTTPETLPLPSGYVRSVFSRAGNYLGLLSISKAVKENPEDRILQLQIFSSTREKLYEIKITKHFDDPLPSVAISDKDGSVVLRQSAVGRLWFYNRNGSLNRDVVLFEDASYDLERVLQMEFTKDGQSLAVLASKRGASPIGSGVPNPSGEPHLILFNLNGEELWRRSLPEFNAGQIAMAPDGQYITVSSYTTDLQGTIKKRTVIFDERGQVITSLDFLFRNADFSPESKYLILAERTVAKVVELPTGKVLWTHNVSRRQGMITEAALSKNGEFGVLLLAKNEFKEGAFIFTNPWVVVLNRSGRVMQQIKIEGQSFYTPALKFSEDNQYLILGLKDSYRIYGIVTK
jgi:hypothetical protein